VSCASLLRIDRDQGLAAHGGADQPTAALGIIVAQILTAIDAGLVLQIKLAELGAQRGSGNGARAGDGGGL